MSAAGAEQVKRVQGENAGMCACDLSIESRRVNLNVICRVECKAKKASLGPACPFCAPVLCRSVPPPLRLYSPVLLVLRARFVVVLWDQKKRLYRQAPEDHCATTTNNKQWKRTKKEPLFGETHGASETPTPRLLVLSSTCWAPEIKVHRLPLS